MRLLNRTVFFGLVIVPMFLGSVLLAEDLWEPIIKRLVSDGMSRQYLEPLFQQTVFDPDPIRSKLGNRFERKFKATRIKRIQEGLTQLGYKPGPVDSLEGPATRAAIQAFQKGQGISVTGRATALVLEEIELKLHPGKTRRKSKTSSRPVYKEILKPKSLAESRQFLQENRSILGQIASQYGVPEEISVGILAIETKHGTYLGKKRAFTTLASLSLAQDFEIVKPFFQEILLTRSREAWLRSNARKVGDWGFHELKALFEYARHANLELVAIPGSVYGAIGISQFMPSNALRFGVDGNQNGIIELFEVEDALHSMANYLKKHGWRKGLNSRSRQARVLYRYNHSRTYVNTVLKVAEEISTSP